MASTKSILARYYAIFRRLKKSPASFNEIVNFLDLESELQNLDLRIATRTFKRTREDMLESFGIEIDYNPKSGKYFIADEDSLDVGNRMFDAYNIASVIQSSDRVSRFILPESRRPLGSEHFHGLVYAIENKRKVSFKYYKIEDDLMTDRQVFPIALKESLGYWYLFAKDYQDERIKTFATDRVSELHIDNKSIKEKIAFDIQGYLSNSYGIIVPSDSKPQRLCLAFAWQQGQYVKLFPLHHSQRVISENEQIVILELLLIITFDFEQKILSFGPDVKVLEPQTLIASIRNYHQTAASQYLGKEG